MNHSVLVLAAGGSRRLGQPKQLLRQRGETLIRRTVRLAQATRPNRICVVIGAEQAAIRAELAGFELEEAVNDQWQTGLASSLQAGIAALTRSAVPSEQAEPVLLLVCDQLHLSVDHLQALLKAGHDQPGVCITSSYGGSIGIPVLATPSLLQSVSQLQADQGLKWLLQTGRWPLATIEAADLAIDLDTPEQCRDAISRGWLDAISPA